MIRKHIVVLGAAVALFAASEAIAQAPAPRDSARRQGEMRRGGRPRGDIGGMRQAAMRGLFRDIDLTQAQRDQMKTVNEKYRTQYQSIRSIRESLEPDLKAAQEARQRGDTVAARAAVERTKTGREKMQALMQQQRTEVRALLTAEQQKQFDTNVAQMKDRMEKHGDRKGRRGR
jgi:Spy/CpxP family protein refolding chaperone